MNMPPPYFKITTQAFFSVKNKVSDGIEQRAGIEGTEHGAWGKPRKS
jgi:hypothetical protein